MTVLELHREAMAQADEAFAARLRQAPEEASRLFREAFQNERLAAEAADKEALPQPTRSILFRSAATLAMDCGEYREAERLAAYALSGDPPSEIAVELRELLMRVWQNQATQVA